MNNIIINDKRKIKKISETILNKDKNNKTLHPLYLSLKPKNNNLLTLHFDANNKITLNMTNTPSHNDNQDISQTIVPLHDDLLIFSYSVDTINELIKFTDKSIENNNPEENIVRVINIWIYHNLDNIKVYNKILFNLFEKINNNYKKKEYKKESIEEFINKWINNKNKSDFNFNLFDDIYNFIKNK